MFNLILHTLMLVAAAYIIGCIVGWLLHWLFAGSKTTATGAAAVAAAPVATAVAASPRPAAAVAAAPVAPALAVMKPYGFKVQNAGGFVLLDGAVPTEAMRADLVAQAERMFAGKTIRNRLTLAGGAPLGFAAATSYSLQQLARLRSGTVQFTDTALRVTGEAAHAEARRSVTGAAVPSGYKMDTAIALASGDGPAIDYARSVAFADKTVVRPAPKGEVAPAAAPAPLVAAAATAVVAPALGSASAMAAGAPSSRPTPAEPTVVLPVQRTTAIQPYRFSADHDGTTIMLDGHVADEAARADAVAAAHAAVPGARIADRLFVGDGAPASHAAGVPFGLSLLSHLDSGRVQVENGQLTVTGIARSGSDLIDLRARTRSLPDGLTLQSLSASQAFGAGDGSVTATNVGHASARVPGADTPTGTSAAATMMPAVGTAMAESASAEASSESSAAATAGTPATAGTMMSEPAMAAAAPAMAAAAVTAAASAIPAVPNPYRAQILRDGQTLTLSGHVASETERAELLADVGARVPGATIIDRLHVAPGAPAGHGAGLLTGAGALASLSRGSARIEAGRLTVEGEADTALAAMDARAALKAVPAGVSVQSVAISQRLGASAPMTATGVAVEASPLAAIAPLAALGLTGASAPAVAAAGSVMATPAERAAEAGASAPAVADTEPVTAVPAEIDDEPVPVIQPAGEAAAASAAAADAVGDRPRGLVAARNGRADDLKRIKGIGPQNEARLNALGIWHFDQISVWTPANSRWVGAFLAFPGRIEREHWIDQATVLAAGGVTEFAKRVDKGDLHYGTVDRAEQARIIADLRHDVETGVKPVGLLAPRGGQGDDLTAIKGIGPAIAKLLNEAGIWHFDQLAALTPAEVHWIEHFVGYPGRAEREGWIEEAKDYAGMS